MNKKGDCFFVALQLIQDYGSLHDRITPVKTYKNIPDDESPMITHAYAIMDDSLEEKSHAWIEVGDWVIDFSNRCGCVQDRHTYRGTHRVREPKSFDRDTVLAVLYHRPPTAF